jgi:hypothetical protein
MVCFCRVIVQLYVGAYHLQRDQVTVDVSHLLSLDKPVCFVLTVHRHFCFLVLLVMGHDRSMWATRMCVSCCWCATSAERKRAATTTSTRAATTSCAWWSIAASRFRRAGHRWENGCRTSSQCTATFSSIGDGDGQPSGRRRRWERGARTMN